MEFRVATAVPQAPMENCSRPICLRVAVGCLEMPLFREVLASYNPTFPILMLPKYEQILATKDMPLKKIYIANLKRE